MRGLGRRNTYSYTQNLQKYILPFGSFNKYTSFGEAGEAPNT